MTGGVPVPPGVGAAGDRLARRYRRLLVTYPRAYRRERGAELLGALLDAAPPGRTRPTVREAANLLRHGLRARLGRPASRTVVVWALLVATISGLFSAGFATRAAWETAPPMPTTDEAYAMVAEILPGQQFTGFQQPPALFTMYGAPLNRELLGEMMFFDGGEYELSGVSGSVVGDPGVPVPELAELARRNLRAHGWTVYSTTTTTDLHRCIGPPCVESSDDLFVVVTARRGDTTFRLEMYSAEVGAMSPVSATFQPATPAAVYPAGAAAGLLGAVLAFMMFGWASRRTHRHPGTAAKVMLGFTLFFWGVPTLLAVPSMAVHHLQEAHPSWHPMWEWFGQPVFFFLFVFGCGSALVGLAVAASARRDRAPDDAVAATG